MYTYNIYIYIHYKYIYIYIYIYIYEIYTISNIEGLFKRPNQDKNHLANPLKA